MKSFILAKIEVKYKNLYILLFLYKVEKVLQYRFENVWACAHQSTPAAAQLPGSEHACPSSYTKILFAYDWNGPSDCRPRLTRNRQPKMNSSTDISSPT